MKDIIAKKSNFLKRNSVIKLLSIIALVCTVLGELFSRFYYGEHNIRFISYSLSIHTIVYLIFTFAPAILLVVYNFKYYSQLKATVIVPIIFGVLLLDSILSAFSLYGTNNVNLLLVDFLIIVYLICLISATISALKGFNKKKIFIISMAICILCFVFSLIVHFPSMLPYIWNSKYLHAFSTLTIIVGYICLYTALLLFGWKNKIPSVISVIKSIQKRKEVTAEKQESPQIALKLLKNKLDFGMITEEEYNTQRAEIISKL